MTLDELDKKILNALQKDARISYNELGTQVGLAASTVHARVKKLETLGVIQGFCAIIDPEKVGYKLIAWVGLSVDPTKLKEIASKLALYERVQTVAIASGAHDILVQIIAEDMKSLWIFINEKIKTLDGIKSNIDVSGFIEVLKMTHCIKIPENANEFLF